MEIDVNLEEVMLSEYKWYSRETYKRSMSLIVAERNFRRGVFHGTGCSRKVHR